MLSTTSLPKLKCQLMQLNRYADGNDPEFRRAAIQSYAKSFRVKGVKTIAVLPASQTDVPGQLSFIVDLQNQSDNPAQMVPIRELLEWLLHCKVLVIVKQNADQKQLQLMEEIPL